MSLLDQLSDPGCWEEYYAYKASLACPGSFLKELRCFIDSGAYLCIVRAMRNGEPFPLPRRAVISKQSSQKKRTVYIYPREETIVLKLLTWLLLRRYDHLFCDNLFSFRPGRTAQSAVRRLLNTPGIRTMYAYRADIHDYFNSVPVERFLPELKAALAEGAAKKIDCALFPPELSGEEDELYAFLEGLLLEPRVLDASPSHFRNLPDPDSETRILTGEKKGIMAGTPLSAFYANLYLRDLDRHFAARNIPYARYSDDIIVFAKSREELLSHRAFIRDFLEERGLEMNPAKEEFSSPGESWTFLGFTCQGKTVDIAPVTVAKLKAKMRRKARALRRWSERKGCSGERAAAAFIRVFNRKLFESAEGSELSWCHWFFSLITTDRSLHEIDLYAQDCLRFLISGKRTKARYNVRYSDLKALGYKSLVNAWYAHSESSGT